MRFKEILKDKDLFIATILSCISVAAIPFIYYLLKKSKKQVKIEEKVEVKNE